MGTWKLEVFRMTIYTMFPVGLFHYFNQPEYFEQWVTDTKRHIIPPEDPKNREKIQKLKNEMRKKQLQNFE